MTQCWSEGALRAYLDRELSPDEIQQVAAHLKECATCDGHCRELSAKAEQVAALIDQLPEPEVETLHVPLRMPGRASSRPRIGWVGAAVALAAGLGIAAYVVPRPQVNPVVTAVAPPVVPAPVAVPQTVTVVTAPAGERSLAVRPARRLTRPTIRPVVNAGDFVALDDEPFESGVIMRVAVTPGSTQADIVFGPDGRARAFRLVQANGQKF